MSLPNLHPTPKIYPVVSSFHCISDASRQNKKNEVYCGLTSLFKIGCYLSSSYFAVLSHKIWQISNDWLKSHYTDAAPVLAVLFSKECRALCKTITKLLIFFVSGMIWTGFEPLTYTVSEANALTPRQQEQLAKWDVND